MSARLTRQMVVRVDDDLYRSLELDAEQNERTIAQSVRLAVRRFVSAAEPPAEQDR